LIRMIDSSNRARARPEEIAGLIERIFLKRRERVRGAPSEGPGSVPVSWVSENQASFFQSSQEIRMHHRKEFESSGLVGLHHGDFQNNGGEAGDLGIFRLCHTFQTSHIPFRNV